tara:strand:+ start:1231 stop:1638 length:408 start_codon:yes stop_codon:yes gene_type:complete
MKQQDIFNKASAHLMGMDGPSLDADGDACVYRGEDGGGCYNGEMCAVGLFIDDEHYDCGFEGASINDSHAVSNAVAQSWGLDELSSKQLALLDDLQAAHDRSSRRIGLSKRIDWSNIIRISLERVRMKHGLEVSA